MIRRLTLLAGGAVGYVLGARAGRERYEQLVRLAKRTSDRPEVQRAAEQVRDTAKATAAGEGPVADAAAKAAAKVRSDGSGGSGGSGGPSPKTGVPDPGAATSAVAADPPPPSSTAGETSKPG